MVTLYSTSLIHTITTLQPHCPKAHTTVITRLSLHTHTHTPHTQYIHTLGQTIKYSVNHDTTSKSKNTLHSLLGAKVTETKGVGLPVSPVEGDTVVCPLTGVALGPAVGVAEGV